MKSWLPNSKIFRIAIVFFAITLLIYLFSLGALLKKKSEIKDHNSQTFSALTQEEDALRLQSILDTNKELIGSVRGFFIPKNDDISFIESIESVGETSGVRSEISSITPGKNKDENKETILVKTNFEGSWVSVMRYLDRLEKMDFGVYVQNINIESPAAGNWEGSVEFIIYKDK